MSANSRPDTPPRGGRGSGSGSMPGEMASGWGVVGAKLSVNVEEREKGPSLMAKAKDKRVAGAWNKAKGAGGPRWLGSISNEGEGAGNAVVSNLTAENRTVLSEDGSYITYKTYKMGQKQLYDVTTGRSLCLFPLESKFRKMMIKFFLLGKYFDDVVLCFILANCILLAVNNPAEWSEYLFIGVFTFEGVAKIIAHGFDRYIRDPWNLLDFVVVVLGYLSLIPQLGNYSAIRALRVFRAFKTINAVPGLQIIVRALTECIKDMLDPMLLIVFCLIFFGIFGLQLYMGKLQQTCVCLPTNYTEIFDANMSSYYTNAPELQITAYKHCGTTGGARACPVDASSYCDSLVMLPSLAVDFDNLTTFADEWVGMDVTAQCVTIDNAGYTNYNNFGFAVLVTLQLFTLDAWEVVYNGILQSTGWVSVLYFALVVFIGGFFVLNLVLAVVTSAFDETKDDVEEEEAEAEAQHLKKTGKNRKKKRVAIEPHVSPGNKQLQRFVESKYFVNFITILIVANTVVMACWYPRMSEEQDLIVSVLNYAFGAFFALEMTLKMIAYGPKDYFFYHPIEHIDPEARSSANWNRFDFLIVVASITEIGLHYGLEGVNSRGLSVLRVFRAVRLVKLVENWQTMQKLVETIGHAMEHISYLVLILVIVIYTFAALGMQTFRGDYFTALNVTTYAESVHLKTTDPALYHSVVPRWNFIDFSHSFMMVFRVLCGEWIEPLFLSWQFSNKTLSFVFFIIALIVGNFIILNLFVALLLGAFDDVEEEDEKEQRVMAAALKLWSSAKPTLAPESETAANDNRKKGTWASTKAVRETVKVKISPEHADKLLTNALLDNTPLCCCMSSLETKIAPFRRKVMQLATSSIFEGIVLIAILSSTIMLAFDDFPNRDNVQLHKALDTGNMVFAVLFTLEMLIKVFGFGWSGYFKNGWNLLDFMLVVVGIVGLALTASSGSVASATDSVRTLRSLRALRPLRAIRRWESMKVVVDALLSSIPAIFNVIIFTFLVFLIFAIFGVQFFGGKFGRCEVMATHTVYNYSLIDEAAKYHNFTTHKEACNSTYIDGFDEGEILWINPSVNFDSTVQAFVALFQLATFEGWMTVLYAGQDATGIDMQPNVENQYYSSIFFVIFIFMGSFFTLNLFIGVIIDNFQDRKRMLENLGKNGGLFLTPSQRRYLNIVRKALAKTPHKMVMDPLGSPIRHFCFRMANSRAFEFVIGACILINSVFFTTSYYGQSETMDIVQWVANTIFVGVFVLEAVIKMVGFGPKGYFQEPWNCFDFAIVVSSTVGLIADMSTGSSVADWADTSGSGSTASMLRLFRIVRLFRFLRFLKYAKNLRRLLLTLFISLPSLLNIFTLFFLMITIYSLVGMSLFKDVVHNGDLNDFVNFETFGSSILLLFRLATAAGMDGLMASCSVEIGCDPDFYGEGQSNCGQPGAAKGYFVSLVIVVFMIVINTYVAIILENMDDLAKEEAQPDSIPPEAVSDFYGLWATYDPHATHFMTYSQLVPFMNDLPTPLGYRGREDNFTLQDLKELRIPLYAGDAKEGTAPERRGSIKNKIKRRLSTSFGSKGASNKVGQSAIEVVVTTDSVFLWRDQLAKDKYGNADDGTTLTKVKHSSNSSGGGGNRKGKVAPLTTAPSGELEAKAHCVSVLTILIEAAVKIEGDNSISPEQISTLTNNAAAAGYKHFRDTTKPITNTFHYDPKEDDDDLSVIELEDATLEAGSPKATDFVGTPSTSPTKNTSALVARPHAHSPAAMVFARGAKEDMDASSAHISLATKEDSAKSVVLA